MPLANRPIACELHLAGNGLYSNTQDIGILQDVNEAALLGCLEQLGLVSRFAAEMFKGLLDAANETTVSANRLRARTDAMLAGLSEAEANTFSDVVSFDFGELGTLRHPDMSSSQMFTTASRGVAVASQYDAITLDRSVRVRQEGQEPPTRVPRFEQIDDLLREHHPEMLATKYGGTTRRQWSFPEYFEEKWIRNENERQEARKKRRKDKRERKDKEQAVFVGAKAEGSAKKVTLQSWDANLEHEGAPVLGQTKPNKSLGDLVSTQQSASPATAAAQGGWKSSRSAYHSRKFSDDEVPEPAAPSTGTPELGGQPAAADATTTAAERRPSRPSRPPPPPKPAGSPAPAAAAPQDEGDLSAGWVPPPPPPKKVLVNREAPSDGGAAGLSSGPQAEAKATARGFLAQIDGLNSSTLRSTGGQDQAGSEGPASAAPAPPARSFLADIGGAAKSLRAAPTSEPDEAAPARPQMSGFLADIGGASKSLRAAKAPEPRPVSAPSNPLMAAIQGLDKSKLKKAEPIAKKPKSRGMLDEIENMSKSKLKSASERRLSAAPEAASGGLFGGSTIQDMLNKRRKDIEMSDSDSEESEDEWD